MEFETNTRPTLDTQYLSQEVIRRAQHAKWPVRIYDWQNFELEGEMDDVNKMELKNSLRWPIGFSSIRSIISNTRIFVIPAYISCGVLNSWVLVVDDGNSMDLDSPEKQQRYDF